MSMCMPLSLFLVWACNHDTITYNMHIAHVTYKMQIVHVIYDTSHVTYDTTRVTYDTSHDTYDRCYI